MGGSFGDFLKGLDWSPLYISLKTGAAATVICFFLGILTAGWIMGRKKGFRALADSILTLPMVIPPTASGFFLLLLFSKKRALGAFLFTNFGFKVIQTWTGCVIAAVVISFPLMYRNARAAFEQVDIDLIYAGRTLGLSDWKIFWRVVFPAARPGIISGTVLTFARAMGEYGATSMLAGNIPGKTGTISQRIAMVIQDGNYFVAGFWTIVVMLIAMAILLAINLFSGNSGKRPQKW
jgi:molybdate transport system permease protein